MLLAALLPPAARVEELVGESTGGHLLPAEERALGQVSPRRRAEFAAGRTCARRAVAGLGLPPAPLLPDAGRAVRWPDGVVGSLTHCRRYTAATVARRADLASVGIDAEVCRPLPRGVLDKVADPRERDHLAALPDHHDVWGTVLFSAKESIYKAWYPLTHAWLGFHDARVEIDPAAGTFTGTLRVPGPLVAGRRLATFTGRFAVRDGLVLTAVTVPAAPVARVGRAATTRHRPSEGGPHAQPPDRPWHTGAVDQPPRTPAGGRPTAHGGRHVPG